jgi:hypothetical protein
MGYCRLILLAAVGSRCASRGSELSHADRSARCRTSAVALTERCSSDGQPYRAPAPRLPPPRPPQRAPRPLGHQDGVSAVNRSARGPRGTNRRHAPHDRRGTAVGGAETRRVPVPRVRCVVDPHAADHGRQRRQPDRLFPEGRSPQRHRLHHGAHNLGRWPRAAARHRATRRGPGDSVSAHSRIATRAFGRLRYTTFRTSATVGPSGPAASPHSGHADASRAVRCPAA